MSTADSSAEPPGPANSTGTQNRRRKTFTGCWTCRSRHVKCDEQRPECRRCLNGGFECSGYGTRLTWVSQAGKPTSRPNRRTGPPRRQPHPPATKAARNAADACQPALDDRAALYQDPSDLSFKETTENIHWVDDEHNHLSLGENGPQSARGAGSQNLNDPAGASIFVDPLSLRYNGTVARYGETSTLYIGQENLSHSSDPALLLPTQGSSESSPSRQFLGWPKGYSIGEWPETSSHSSDKSVTPPIGNDLLPIHPNSFTSTLMPSPGYDPLLLYMPIPGIPSPERPLDTFSTLGKQRELIGHWVTQICDKLIPVRNATNPFLSIVAPMALEGSRAAKNRSSSTVALFHAVCAAAATHQANLKGGSRDMSNLALEHTQLSFHHLMKNIHLEDDDERMASLGTLCVWLFTHFVSGTPRAWREIVKVARNLLQSTSKQVWTKSLATSMTYQCYISFIPLIQSQYLGCPNFPDPLDMEFAAKDMMKTQAMSKELLELISSYNTKLLQGKIMDEDELDRLEIEFTLSVPSLSEGYEPGTENGDIIHHHSYLFYSACLLYFKCTSGRRGSEEDIQDLVEKCVEHIERLNAIQKGANSRTWIYATVAFEAKRPQLRERVREAFAYRKTLAFSTFDVLLRAAEEVWKIRDQTAPAQIVEPWPLILVRMPQFDVIWY